MATLSPQDALLVPRLRKAGIKMPVRMILAARKVKLPLAYAAALLMKETGGGSNVFGHDPTIFAGAGEVTEEKYLAYKRQRGPTGKGGMQGVGPTQLTWYSFQDQADALGGAWKPQVNMIVGFALLKSLIQRNGVAKGFAAYNGSGPAADAYGKDALEKVAPFETLLRESPPGPAVKKPRIPLHWWKQFVYGDTDVQRSLLTKLANVAQDRGPGMRVFIRSGGRTFAEQAVLYAKYQRDGSPLAAKPGTSRHETRRAADCQLVFPDGRQVDIGADSTAPALLAKRNLHLPVAGEAWHVEER